MKRTISAMVGQGSVNHNSRKFHAKNTDPERSHLNITYCQENIKAVYHELFDEALERYNAKQTRADRRIEDYYEKIRSGKQEKPFHEIILQVGNRDDMSADSEEGQLAAAVLDEYMKGFQERNPQLRVFSAHLHMDEAIGIYLNEHGIPSPSMYKQSKGLPVGNKGSGHTMWTGRMIHAILTNPTYSGDLAQGRYRVKSYKVHEIEAVPEDEWVRVSNTHEAIIDRETFDMVQSLLKRDTRTSPQGREVHVFSGFLKCADCGRALTRSSNKNGNVYYACSTYKNMSKNACTMHSIKHNRLEAAVLFAIQQQVHLAVSYSDLVARINAAPAKRCQSHRLNDLIAAKERELAKVSRYKQSIYQDWKDGEITQQEYHDMKADYEQKTASLTDILARLTAERDELANGVNNEHPALVAFMKYQNISTLTREILIELVDHIKVYDNGNISVKFKFADELRKIAEYIQLNTVSQPEAV